MPETDFRAVGRGLTGSVVARAGPDYRALLAGAALSVSQCGYNTAVDLLATGTPAVLVPFEAGGETEQRLRAAVFARHGLGYVLPEHEVSPDSLIETITAALAAPPPGPHGIDLDGAARSVAIVAGLVRGTGADSYPARRSHPPSPQEGLAEAFAGDSRRPVGASQNALDRLRATLDAAAARAGTVGFWWRDDDAVAATPALERLLDLMATRDAPLLLAAIPAGAEPSLGRRLADAENVHLAVHGLAHANHAPAGEKPAEFGAHRPLAALVGDGVFDRALPID